MLLRAGVRAGCGRDGVRAAGRLPAGRGRDAGGADDPLLKAAPTALVPQGSCGPGRTGPGDRAGRDRA
ncbi:hypothetical protein DB35_12095 [Streptomyces abyssalis]|uniref:Uncharacterized protein n=1 Tax=Streptomyces abyssalis TaxID=933944 RepID=A0A1E7JHA0_9ACTN|nr:hypothetical protein AN215_25845 [Streptomyces abyssalis]OEU92709.1 hypothetical protein DB35_12095 [Streptomyces abyssalis]